MQLADAWWNFGELRKGEARDARMLRAGHWYQQVAAAPQVGLNKLKLEKRFQALIEVEQRHRLLQAKRMLRPSDRGGTNELWTDATP